MNELAGSVDLRLEKWPDTEFSVLVRNTHVSCDTNTVLTLISEITWNVKAADQHVTQNDPALRHLQVRDELQRPFSRHFALHLLKSGLRLAISERNFDQLRHIVAIYAGPREKARYEDLLRAQMLQAFVDDSDARDAEIAAKDEPLSVASRNKTCPLRRFVQGRFTDISYVDPAVFPQRASARKLLDQVPAELVGRYDGRQTFERLDWSLFPAASQHEDDQTDAQDDPTLGDIELIKSLQEEEETGQRRCRSPRPDPGKRRRLEDDDRTTVLPCAASLTDEESHIRRRWTGGRPADDKNVLRRSRRIEALQQLEEEGVGGILKCTRRVTQRHIDWLDASFKLSMPVVSGDSGLLRALKDQKLHLDNLRLFHTHPPRSLIGL